MPSREAKQDAHLTGAAVATYYGSSVETSSVELRPKYCSGYQTVNCVTQSPHLVRAGDVRVVHGHLPHLADRQRCVHLGAHAELAERIRQRLREEVGVASSISHRVVLTPQRYSIRYPMCLQQIHKTTRRPLVNIHSTDQPSVQTWG